MKVDFTDQTFTGQGARTDSTNRDGEVGRVVDVKRNCIFCMSTNGASTENGLL